MDKQDKVQIERTIERARDGVSERIDELDRRLRTTLDVKSMASTHAPKIIGAGAVLGFLVGFGMPKAFRKIVGIGLPLALVALKVRSARNGDDVEYDDVNYDG